MKRLLITGFAPFGGDTVNPALQAVQALPLFQRVVDFYFASFGLPYMP